MLLLGFVKSLRQTRLFSLLAFFWVSPFQPPENAPPEIRKGLSEA
jgi:hypothetical protein